MLPQVPTVSRRELLTRLAGTGAARPTVLTPNARLAQSLQREFDRARAAEGRASWETADILAFGAFVQRLWEDALYSPRGGAVPVLLTPVQELAAWEEAVRASDVADPVFSAPAAAAQCREAWQLAHAWRVGTRRDALVNEDAQAWLDWSARYERATRGHTDTARLPDLVARWLDLDFPKPAVVVLAGFDIVTPQLADFLKALAASGTRLEQLEAAAGGGTVSRIPLTRPVDEIAAAARWARARLAASSRIGVVVPDLRARRAEVERIFAGVLAPGRALDPSRPLPFDISLGRPLAEVPLVADALAVLELAGPSIAFGAASRLLRSPFLGAAESESEIRSRLDAWLRERAGPDLSLDALLRLAAASPLRAARLLDRLSALAAQRKAIRFGAKDAAAWARAFSEALRDVGFPGERTLDSAEHQALDRWHALLAEFGSVEPVASKMGYVEACGRLRRMAQAAVFQPETPETPIQVVGVLESAGLEFDHLWVMGLTDDAWPMPARPSPFLPVRAQRAAGIPQADPAASLELDRRITEGWKRAAAEVVFSHARAEGDSELAPSPLIAAVPAATLGAVGVPEAPTLRGAIRAAGRLARIEDAKAPPIEAPEQRGGTSLFRDQAACAFRGYARYRLNARSLETPRFGLDARDRGNLVHEMLAEAWKVLESRDGLLSRDAAQLAAILGAAADKAIANVQRKRGDALRGRFERLERERLLGLAREWLEVEKARPDFQVLATEDERPLTYGGVTVKARLDRMDAVAKGRAVIDYKTGQCATSSWFDGPEEPQLPMYALAGMDVSAVAFAQVKAGEMCFKGIGREADLVPGVKLVTKDQSRGAKRYPDWDALVAAWRESLDRIGRSYAQGEAAVDPRRGPLTCERCDQHTFCRIAEKAAFGVRKGDDADE